MDIEIVRAAKAQCESEIRAILAMFHRQTGIRPMHVSLEYVDVTTFEDQRRRYELAKVTMETEGI